MNQESRNITSSSDGHPKVFVSYSHENEEYEKKVLEFTNRLRQDGIDASVDLYEDAPKEGWPRWMENQIRWADFVLVIASKSYYEKFYDEDVNVGKGVGWEVSIIYQNLYVGKAETSKFIPVFFENSDQKFILTPLKAFTYYNISEDKDYENLYRRLRGIPKNVKPQLGELRPLEPKEQKTMFYSTPIDVDKWDKAGWKGMVYLFQEGMVPVLGLMFTDYAAAKEIFKEWRYCWGNSFADENLCITYVVQPFPKDCYVYKRWDHSFGKGYFIHIGQNLDAATERALHSGIKPLELLLVSVSRYIWVDEVNGSANREKFMEMREQCGRFQLMPMALKNPDGPFTEDNINIGSDVAIWMKNLNVKKGIDVGEDDQCKAVFEER